MIALRKILFVILLALSGMQILLAQVLKTETAIESYTKTIECNFSSSQEIIGKFPTTPEMAYSEMYLYFTKFAIFQDRYSTDAFLKRSKLWKETFGGKNTYMHAELEFMNSAAHILNQSYLKAIIHVSRSNKYLQKSIADTPYLNENKKLNGIFNLIFGSIPDNYKWAINLIGINGDINKGFSELELYYLNSVAYNKLESVLLFSFAHNIFKPDDSTSLKILEKHYTEFQSNPIFQILYASTQISKHNHEKALQIIANSTNLPPLILTYANAMFYLNPEKSLPHYQRFINTNQSPYFVKYANQKISECYALLYNEEQYNSYREATLHEGTLIIEADKRAVKLAIPYTEIDQRLLKSRIYFDGGSYKKAEIELKKVSIAEIDNNKQLKLEVYYRLARIYHENKNISEAIKYYSIVLNEFQKDESYYPANSALKLGIIHETLNNTERAIYYYNTCLNMNPDTYKNSIHMLAKSSLNRLTK